MRISFFVCLIIIVLDGFTQENPKFPDAIFSDPGRFKDLLDKSFEYSEIDTYSRNIKSNTVFLENGYAEFKFKNVDEWVKIMPYSQVKKISVIYTKYPINKIDWITDYYDLLSDRLQALFELDSSLNRQDIEWCLVAQNSCLTSDDAKGLLHGIEIEFLNITVEKSEKVWNIHDDDNIIYIKSDDIIKSENYLQIDSDNYKFPEDLIKQEKKHGKTFRRKEPGCPDFSKRRRKLFFKQ